MHQGFDGVGINGSGEAFVGGLHSFDDGDGHVVFGKFGVEVEHAACFGDGFLGGDMDGVPFLPEEFGGAEEESGAQLPSDDVGPLVHA